VSKTKRARQMLLHSLVLDNDAMINDSAHPVLSIKHGRKVDKSLLKRERDMLTDLLANVDCTRYTIAKIMMFCIEHAEFSQECIEMLYERIKQECHHIGILYVFSDIMFNSNSSVRFAGGYRLQIQNKLPLVFHQLGLEKAKTRGKIGANQMDSRIHAVLNAWRSMMIFGDIYLHGLEICYSTATDYSFNISNGECFQYGVISKDQLLIAKQFEQNTKQESDSIDGLPLLSDDELDENAKVVQV